MTDIRVPTLGESVTEATIGKWFKKAGDAVAVDEPLVELETDKVTIEVPAPAAGVLSEIAAKDGETVAVGALLGQIKDGAGARQGCRRADAPARPTKRPAPRHRSRPARNDGQGARAGQAGSNDAEAVGRHAARAVGAQDVGGKRRRSVGVAGTRQGRPRHQGRHDGRDRARRLAADAGRSAGRRRADARAVARRRRRARRAREDDAAAPDHRAPPEGRAEHRRHAHDLQRGRHDARSWSCAINTRNCSRRSTA